MEPTSTPSFAPTANPTSNPSSTPSYAPTSTPTNEPSTSPSSMTVPDWSFGGGECEGTGRYLNPRQFCSDIDGCKQKCVENSEVCGGFQWAGSSGELQAKTAAIRSTVNNQAWTCYTMTEDSTASTLSPSSEPSSSPSKASTATPSLEPTVMPTPTPSQDPTDFPTTEPSS